MVAESKPLLDNERVKVSEVRIGPGERLPMHTHGRYINYDFETWTEIAALQRQVEPHAHTWM